MRFVKRKASRRKDGLCIITSLDGERLNGQIVNTVIQVTSEPARMAVIFNKQNLAHEFISKSGFFGDSVLEESAPMTFLGPFGFRSGREAWGGGYSH